MNTIHFEVATPKTAQADLLAAAKTGKPAPHARLTFPSAVAMARVLTPTRWALVQLLTGAGPVGIRELPRPPGAMSKAFISMPSHWYRRA